MKCILIKALYAAAVAVLLAFSLYCLHLMRRAFVADKFINPSDSMHPTLGPGDEVWVNKLLMGARIYTDFFDWNGGPLHSFRTRGLCHFDLAEQANKSIVNQTCIAYTVVCWLNLKGETKLISKCLVF